MPRPTKPRLVEFAPSVTYFKPAGIPMRRLEEVVLGLDELEAIRLKDSVGLDQEECASRMNLAQSTFQRVLTAARTKLASALVEGKAIRIEGGNYLLSWEFLCEECNRKWPRMLGRPEERSREVCPECGSQDVRLLRTGSGGSRDYPGNPSDDCPDGGPWPSGQRGQGRHRRGRGGPGGRR